MSGIVDGDVGYAAAWVTPMLTIINAINGGLDTNNFSSHGTDLSAIAQSVPWTSWSPTLAASGSMTFTSTVVNYAKYVTFGKVLIFQCSVTGTTGGSAARYLSFTPPATLAQGSAILTGGGYVNDNSQSPGAVVFGQTTSLIYVGRADFANYTLAGSEGFSVFGIMELA